MKGEPPSSRDRQVEMVQAAENANIFLLSVTGNGLFLQVYCSSGIVYKGIVQMGKLNVLSQSVSVGRKGKKGKIMQ